MPQRRKAEVVAYIEQHTDLMTDVEMALNLAITPERVGQYRRTYGIKRRIYTLADAMAEIRRLRSLMGSTGNIDLQETNVVA